jgi:hypothetical protein
MEIRDGYVDGRPYRVSHEPGWGWIVTANDGTEVIEQGWRWSSRAVARTVKAECEMFGHRPNKPGPDSTR